jgi:hypothetical protein
VHRRRTWWPLGVVAAGAVLAGALLIAVAPTRLPSGSDANAGATSTDPALGYATVFDGTPLSGSGWAACSTPITWSVDLGRLDEGVREHALEDLTWAVDAWASASGLTVSRVESTSLSFDDATSAAVPADGRPQARHIYVDFVPDHESTYLRGRVVGVTQPTYVIAGPNEIVQASVVIRTDFMDYATQSESRALLLHELGHALGLGHVDVDGAVMNPIVAQNTTFAPGDRAGITALGKPCDAGLARFRDGPTA